MHVPFPIGLFAREAPERVAISPCCRPPPSSVTFPSENSRQMSCSEIARSVVTAKQVAVTSSVQRNSDILNIPNDNVTR